MDYRVCRAPPPANGYEGLPKTPPSWGREDTEDFSGAGGHKKTLPAISGGQRIFFWLGGQRTDGLRPEGWLKLKDKIAATVELSRLATIGPRCRSYAAAEGQV